MGSSFSLHGRAPSSAPALLVVAVTMPGQYSFSSVRFLMIVSHGLHVFHHPPSVALMHRFAAIAKSLLTSANSTQEQASSVDHLRTTVAIPGAAASDRCAAHHTNRYDVLRRQLLQVQLNVVAPEPCVHQLLAGELQ